MPNTHFKLHHLPTVGVILASAFAGSALQAQGLPPIVDSLEQRQQVAYIQNAPKGDDERLHQPILEAVVSLEPADPVTSEIVEDINRVVKTAALAQDSKNQDIGSELDLFGYDLFNTAPTSFVQLNNMPAPAHYRIGVGDTLLVQLYGKKNVEYRLVVQRDGNLLVPEIGPVNTVGLDFESLTRIIQEEFQKRMIGAKAAGMRTAFINRRERPFERTPHLPDITVRTIQDLADLLA